MKTRTLLLKLAKWFPKSTAKRYHDHVGLMCGKLKEEVHKILLCLDFDEEVLPLALKEKPDLIISHHPFIFGTKAKVFKYDAKKKELYHICEEAGLTIYSMHTNFDAGKNGMNDALAEALGLENIHPLQKEPMARIGTLSQPMEVHEFARFAKEKFHVEYGLLIAKGKKEVQSVAIIGGGGSRNYKEAMLEGADIYISGDAPHHVRRSIVLDHMNYLDLPHEIEKIFMPQMKKIILGFDSSLEIVMVDHETLPEVI